MRRREPDRVARSRALRYSKAAHVSLSVRARSPRATRTTADRRRPRGVRVVSYADARRRETRRRRHPDRHRRSRRRCRPGRRRCRPGRRRCRPGRRTRPRRRMGRRTRRASGGTGTKGDAQISRRPRAAPPSPPPGFEPATTTVPRSRVRRCATSPSRSRPVTKEARSSTPRAAPRPPPPCPVPNAPPPGFEPATAGFRAVARAPARYRGEEDGSDAPVPPGVSVLAHTLADVVAALDYECAVAIDDQGLAKRRDSSADARRRRRSGAARRRRALVLVDRVADLLTPAAPHDGFLTAVVAESERWRGEDEASGRWFTKTEAETERRQDGGEASPGRERGRGRGRGLLRVHVRSCSFASPLRKLARAATAASASAAAARGGRTPFLPSLPSLFFLFFLFFLPFLLYLLLRLSLPAARSPRVRLGLLGVFKIRERGGDVGASLAPRRPRGADARTSRAASAGARCRRDVRRRRARRAGARPTRASRFATTPCSPRRTWPPWRSILARRRVADARERALSASFAARSRRRRRARRPGAPAAAAANALVRALRGTTCTGKGRRTRGEPRRRRR